MINRFNAGALWSIYFWCTNIPQLIVKGLDTMLTRWFGIMLMFYLLLNAILSSQINIFLNEYILFTIWQMIFLWLGILAFWKMSSFGQSGILRCIIPLMHNHLGIKISQSANARQRWVSIILVYLFMGLQARPPIYCSSLINPWTE